MLVRTRALEARRVEAFQKNALLQWEEGGSECGPNSTSLPGFVR